MSPLISSSTSFDYQMLSSGAKHIRNIEKNIHNPDDSQNFVILDVKHRDKNVCDIEGFPQEEASTT